MSDTTGLFRHTAVYGVGQLLARVGSVLMLPVYTRYLTPADYGTIAIFDLLAAMLVIVCGFGLAQAAQRHHFEAETERRRALWSTAVAATTLPPIPFLVIAWIGRAELARATHGTTAVADLYTLVLPTLWLTAIGLTADTYLRTCKRSGTVVAISLAGLLLNIALNLHFLVVANMGVAGVLLGNLIATGVTTAARAAFLFLDVRPALPSRSEAAVLWRFGAPLTVAALMAAGMHQLDRYYLRLFRDLDEVGLYSLAYTLAQGAASLLLVPFSASWEAVRYEIARDRDAPLLYARAFRGFMTAMALLAFGVALFADEVLAILAPPSYRPAAALVPIIVLAYTFFSMHLHFSVPAFLHNVPQRTMPVFAVALAVNIAGNVALVPSLGSVGAAIATLVTFVTFAAFGLYRYSQLERYPYPLGWCAATITIMVIAFAVIGTVTADLAMPTAVAAKAATWLGAAAFLLTPLRRDLALFGIAAGERSRLT